MSIETHSHDGDEKSERQRSDEHCLELFKRETVMLLKPNMVSRESKTAVSAQRRRPKATLDIDVCQKNIMAHRHNFLG